MILSVNSTPSAGYYTFLIHSSDGIDSPPYRVTTETYTTVIPLAR